jgi:glutamate-1-semialdehyde 2,1-aminomutase
MNFQAGPAPIRSIADLAGADPRLKDLLFFFMAERGIYLARRGFVVLSLQVTDAHVDRFVAAFDGFAERVAEISAVAPAASHAGEPKQP